MASLNERELIIKLTRPNLISNVISNSGFVQAQYVVGYLQALPTC